MDVTRTPFRSLSPHGDKKVFLIVSTPSEISVYPSTVMYGSPEGLSYLTGIHEDVRASIIAPPPYIDSGLSIVPGDV